MGSDNDSREAATIVGAENQAVPRHSTKTMRLFRGLLIELTIAAATASEAFEGSRTARSPFEKDEEGEGLDPPGPRSGQPQNSPANGLSFHYCDMLTMSGRGMSGPNCSKIRRPGRSRPEELINSFS